MSGAGGPGPTGRGCEAHPTPEQRYVALDLLADREERDFKAIQPSTPSLQMGVVVFHGATVLGVVTGSESCFWPGEVPLPARSVCCL